MIGFGHGQVAQSSPASEAKPGPVALAGRKEEDELRNLILTMVDEPLAIVIKLADRLHNMRTVWALKPGKARAVATETLSVWCSLAERLGIFALKVCVRRSSTVAFWHHVPLESEMSSLGGAPRRHVVLLLRPFQPLH